MTTAGDIGKKAFDSIHVGQRFWLEVVDGAGKHDLVPCRVEAKLPGRLVRVRTLDDFAFEVAAQMLSRTNEDPDAKGLPGDAAFDSAVRGTRRRLGIGDDAAGKKLDLWKAEGKA